jgi:hypothetical protein
MKTSMPETTYRGRRAVVLENPRVRVTVTREGGHIAEIFDKQAGVNPLWTPPWPSLEPSAFDPARTDYGEGAEARLLAGIMGHNLCLDLFGGPSPEEAAAGMTVHGEGSVAPYEITEDSGELIARATLPAAQLRFERRLTLQDRAVRIHETVENLSACDRPIAWTQHVTLGPPFLEKGVTQFRASATRSKVYEQSFGAHDYLKIGAEFDWPMAPRSEGGMENLQALTVAPSSCAYTSHLMDSAREHAFFVAFSPSHRLAFGYVWNASDFPWMGIWEENHSRTAAPWNGRTLTRGMEFGVSPVPESRRAMIDRNSLFGVPGYRWIPARARLEAEYYAVTRTADNVPESLNWPSF